MGYYSVKKKLVDGKVCSGVVNSSLDTVVPFIYDSIEIVDYLCICYKDGKPTIMSNRFDKFDTLIEIDDEITIKFLISQYDSGTFLFIAAKNYAEGIIEVKAGFDDINSKDRKIIKPSTYRVLYDFKRGLDIYREYNSTDFLCKLINKDHDIGIFMYDDKTGKETIVGPYRNLNITNYVYDGTYNNIVTFVSGNKGFSGTSYLYQIYKNNLIKLMDEDELYTKISIEYKQSRDDNLPRMTGLITTQNFRGTSNAYGFCLDTNKNKLHRVFKEQGSDFSSNNDLHIVRNKGKYGVFIYELGTFSSQKGHLKPKKDADYIASYLVPCEYDELKLDYRAIIGKKEDSKDLILYTKEPYRFSKKYHKQVLANYTDIKQLAYGIYSCTKQDGKIDLVGTCDDMYRPEEIENKDCFIAKDIDTYIVYSTHDSMYIQTQKNGKYNLFFNRTPYDFSKYGKDPDDITAINKTDAKLLFKVFFNDGTVLLFNGIDCIYSTTIGNLAIDDLDYYYHPDYALLVEKRKDTFTPMQLDTSKPCPYPFLLNKSFSYLKIDSTYSNYKRHMLFAYTELIDDKEISTLSRNKVDNSDGEEILLQGDFKIESDILSNTCVLSKIDPSTNQKVYGVYSFDALKMCVDFGLTAIEPVWNCGKLEYNCTLTDGTEVTLDDDGFVITKNENGSQRNRS